MPSAALAGAVSFGALVATVDPNEPGLYPTCPVLALSGLYCPGCGSLRALHALAHGDLVTALERNPLFVVALAFLVVAFPSWALGRWRGTSLSWDPSIKVISLVLGLVVAFTVLRNVPGWTWLSPA